LLRRKREDALAEDDLPQELARASDEAELASALPALQVKDLRRVLLPWLLIQLVLAVIGWFRRSYARNLGQLIGTVLLSLAYAPKHWLANAAVLAEQAWRDLAREPQYQHWPSQPPAVYGFGHSLGGLLSLSLPALPALIGPDAASPWEPQVILACDPATSTEMGIPGFAIALLKLFGSPFTAEPLRIQDTGPCLSQPVVILHGLADTLVPPQQWDPQGSDGGLRGDPQPRKSAVLRQFESPTQPTPAGHPQPGGDLHKVLRRRPVSFLRRRQARRERLQHRLPSMWSTRRHQHRASDGAGGWS
jgi:hypothetical protein